LTKEEASLATEKQKKKKMHFPMRKYAVKVRGVCFGVCYGLDIVDEGAEFFDRGCIS